MLILRRSLSFALYKKELISFIGFVITTLISISLYSYHATDPSWFYYTSQPHTIKNWCGLVGSHSASLFFFLFGIGAYCMVPFMALLSYWLSWRVRWQDEWERLVAGIGLLGIISALCTMHFSVLQQEIIAGGYIGYCITDILYQLFDRVGSFVLLYAMGISFFIIMFRFSFIQWAQQIGDALTYFYQLSKQYRVMHHLKKNMGRVTTFVMQPFIYLFRLHKQFLHESIEEISDESITQYNVDDLQLSTPIMPDQKIIDDEKIMHPVETDEIKENNSHITDDLSVIQNAPLFENSTSDERASYGLPNLDIFIGVKEKREDKEYRNELEERARILEEKLERFGVYGTVVSIKTGPVVTLFEYQPNIDTKLSKILALEDDLALALQAMSIRILAPIPGRCVVGFEVANKDRKDVLFAQVIQSPEYEQGHGSLPLILGKDTIGNNVVIDLAKAPHLLIAGSTGSGKSVALNAMLMSLLCKCTPDELKLILIDPKRLEFAPYADIAHLLFPIVTDAKRSIPILRWIVHQMEERYEKMAQYGARNIFDYNESAPTRNEKRLPFIVVVIDELSDLMLTVGREIEDVVLRITQMARAAGIHMIVATQRPSVDVITGLIKVNFPSRISFRVTSRIDSRTILDCGGADKLLGRGDMLFLDSTASVLRRIHGAYVSDREINVVISHIKSQQVVHYLDVNEHMQEENGAIAAEDEALYGQIVTYLHEVEEVSISLLQRRFRIGYNRSARIIDMLENRGLIMPADGSRTRRVIR